MSYLFSDGLYGDACMRSNVRRMQQFTVWMICFTGRRFLQERGGTDSSCLLWRACGHSHSRLLCHAWRSSSGTRFLIFHMHLQRYVTALHSSCREYDEAPNKTRAHKVPNVHSSNIPECSCCVLCMTVCPLASDRWSFSVRHRSLCAVMLLCNLEITGRT